MKTSKTFNLLRGVALLFTLVALIWVCCSWFAPEFTGNFTTLSSHINGFLYFSDIPMPAFYLPAILCLLLSGYGLLNMKKGKLLHYLIYAIPILLFFGIGILLMWKEQVSSTLFVVCAAIALALAIGMAIVRPKAS